MHQKIAGAGGVGKSDEPTVDSNKVLGCKFNVNTTNSSKKYLVPKCFNATVPNNTEMSHLLQWSVGTALQQIRAQKIKNASSRVRATASASVPRDLRSKRLASVEVSDAVSLSLFYDARMSHDCRHGVHVMTSH